MSYYRPDHRFLHVAFNFRSVATQLKNFEPLFSQATSWYRYAPNCWIVWTNGTPESWYNYLAPHITQDDYLLVVELHMRSKQGWLPQNAWDWMRERGA